MLIFLLVYPLQSNSNQKFFRNICCCNNSNISKSSPVPMQQQPSPFNHKRHFSSEIVAEPVLIIHTEQKKNAKILKTKKGNALLDERYISSSSQKIKKVMRKTLLFGSISLFAELSLIGVNFFLNQHSNAGSRRIFTLIYDINVMLNLLFIVFSFSSYDKILLSPFTRKK